MALVSCSECSRQISDKAPTCPGCGAPVAKEPSPPTGDLTFDGEKEARLYGQIGGTSHNQKSTSPVAWGVGILLVLVSLSYCATRGDTPAEAHKNTAGLSKTTVTHSQALLKCQEAMKRLSKDPEKAVVPYVGGEEGYLTSTFKWSASTSLMRMRNGLGLEVGTSGVCVIDRVDGSVMELELDGMKVR